MSTENQFQMATLKRLIVTRKTNKVDGYPNMSISVQQQQRAVMVTAEAPFDRRKIEASRAFL